MVHAGNVAAGVVVDGPRIDHRFSVSMTRMHIVRCQWREPREFPKDVRAATIHRPHVVKVGRITGHACQQALGERLRVRQCQEWIGATLPTDGAGRFRAPAAAVQNEPAPCVG